MVTVQISPLGIREDARSAGLQPSLLSGLRRMTKGEIKEIENRLQTEKKWHILSLQSDVRKLLDEVMRLRRDNKKYRKLSLSKQIGDND